MEIKSLTLTPKSLTEEWLNRLEIGGCNPKNYSKYRRFMAYGFIFYNSLMITLMLINSILTDFENIGHFAENLIIILGFFQEIIKIVACLKKASVMNKMIDIIWNDFWLTSIEKDKINSKIKKKIMKIYKYLQMIAKGYGYNVICATVFFVIGAMLIGDRALPMDIWLPNKNIIKQFPYYEIVSMIEIVFTISSAVIYLIPFDALFIIIIGLIYCQFLLINDKLKNLAITLHTDNQIKSSTPNNDNNDILIIKECIAHHNLMLRCLEMLEEVYSNTLFLTIGSNLLLTTLSMYGIVMELETSRRVTFCFVFTGIFLQLYFYCQTGQFIQDKVESIGQAAYNCNWILMTKNETKMAIKLIIQRSQRPFNVTMGGFLALNLETFATVVKTSFSFLTFLENVKS